MFKKNKKQTETLKEPKEKKVRTVKVGTHKKNRDCVVGGTYCKRELWGV